MKKNLILCCYVTGVYDVNRNTILPDNNFSFLKDWAHSVIALNLNGIIFHNNLSADTVRNFKCKNIRFSKIAFNPVYTPNTFRYFVYQKFLNENTANIDHVFITDSTDVTVLQNPFTTKLFLDHSSALFCGDENELLEKDWMVQHGSHLRETLPPYACFEEKFKKETLLNCGIVGGALPVMLELLEKLCHLHEKYNQNNSTAYTGDMGAFNYIARTHFNNRLIHGQPVNTIFKDYDQHNKICWFRHK